MEVTATGHRRHETNAVFVYKEFTLGGVPAPPFLRTHLLQHLTRPAELGGTHSLTLSEKAKRILDKYHKNGRGKPYSERYVDSLLEMQNKVNRQGNWAVLTAGQKEAIKSAFIFDGDTIKVRPVDGFKNAEKPPPDGLAEKIVPAAEQPIDKVAGKRWNFEAE